MGKRVGGRGRGGEEGKGRDGRGKGEGDRGNGREGTGHGMGRGGEGKGERGVKGRRGATAPKLQFLAPPLCVCGFCYSITGSYSEFNSDKFTKIGQIPPQLS